ncbi:MAG: type II toxin-antitoxin system VapC family toxin [Pseudonocardiaceae bacterium]
MAIVDASVVVEFVAPDADDTEASHLLFDRWVQTDEELHAPAMLRLEAMNALLTGVRQQRWDGQAADAASSLVASLPVTLHDDEQDRHRAWELARRYDNYPIYDMRYVALAERLGEPLVTVDDKLHRRLAHLGLVVRPDEALEAR